MNDLTGRYAAGIMVHRDHPRYAVPWKIAVVYKRMGVNETYFGNICDLSLGGVSFFADMKISSPEPVVATIEIPAGMHSQRSTIVGVRCNILHSVLTSSYGKFRVGVRFTSFEGKGKGDLAEALSRLVVIEDKSQPFR